MILRGTETMKTLTRHEELFLEALLKREKRNLEEYLENNSEAFEAYFIRNETLPFIESVLAKIEI